MFLHKIFRERFSWGNSNVIYGITEKRFEKYMTFCRRKEFLIPSNFSYLEDPINHCCELLFISTFNMNYLNNSDFQKTIFVIFYWMLYKCIETKYDFCVLYVKNELLFWYEGWTSLWNNILLISLFCGAFSEFLWSC